jgi:hypothetical protein
MAHSCFGAFLALSAFHQCSSALIGGSNAFDLFSALSAVKKLFRETRNPLSLCGPLLSPVFSVRVFLLIEFKTCAGAIR